MSELTYPGGSKKMLPYGPLCCARPLSGPGYACTRGLHPQCVNGCPGRKQHGPMIRPAPGTVRRDFGQANDPQVVTRGVKDPAAFRACAIDSPFYIDLHTIGHTVCCRSQSGKNAIVAQGTVSGHIKGADA